jgi:hypothetical protein
MYFNAVWKEVLVLSAPGARAPIVFIMGLLFVYIAIRRPDMVSKQWSVPAPVLTDCKAYNLTYIVEVNDYVSELSKLAPWTRKLLPTSYIFPTHTW